MILSFILLRGKDFSLPDGASTAIIGVFFGLVCGLFYYQSYYKPYYWWFSLGGGLILTFVTRASFAYFPGVDTSSLWYTLASFASPFFLTLALNQYLSLVKKRRRKKRLRRKEHSQFFDTVDAQEIFRTPNSATTKENP